jgi:hypothetical protein
LIQRLVAVALGGEAAVIVDVEVFPVVPNENKEAFPSSVSRWGYEVSNKSTPSAIDRSTSSMNEQYIKKTRVKNKNKKNADV